MRDSWSDISALGDTRNWEMATKRVGDAAGDWGDSVGKKGFDFLGDYKNTVKLNQSRIDLRKNNSAAVDEINGKGRGDVSSKHAAMQAVADSMTTALGKEKSVVSIGDSSQLRSKTDVDGNTKEGKGMSDNESKNVVVNIKKTNLMDTNDTITTLAHEIGHQVDRSGGESSADRTSEIMNRAWSRENAYEGTSGYTDTSKSHHLFYELSKGSQTVQ